MSALDDLLSVLVNERFYNVAQLGEALRNHVDIPKAVKEIAHLRETADGTASRREKAQMSDAQNIEECIYRARVEGVIARAADAELHRYQAIEAVADGIIDAFVKYGIHGGHLSNAIIAYRKVKGEHR